MPKPTTTPDPEVTAKTQRRRFTAEQKRRILTEADKCKKPGEIGALLRREGLYSSHLCSWRAARERDGKAGLDPKKRGPKAKAKPDDSDRKIVELERELAKVKARAERAEFLVDMQKKWHSFCASFPRRRPRDRAGQSRRHRRRRTPGL